MPVEGSSVASWQDSETAFQEDKKRRKIMKIVAGTFFGPLISMKCLSVALELM